MDLIFATAPGQGRYQCFPLRAVKSETGRGCLKATSGPCKWGLQLPGSSHARGGQLDSRSNRCACFPIPILEPRCAPGKQAGPPVPLTIQPLLGSGIQGTVPWMRVSSSYRPPEKGCANGAHPHLCFSVWLPAPAP